MILAMTKLTAVGLFSAFMFLGYQGGERQAQAGDIAAGEVLSFNNTQLQLNTTPCGSYRNIVIFHGPYRRVRSDRGSCNGRVYERVQVEQQ